MNSAGQFIEKFDISDVDWNQIATLFEQVGWGKREPLKIKTAFERSSWPLFLAKFFKS